jgi:hypothetical protein
MRTSVPTKGEELAKVCFDLLAVLDFLLHGVLTSPKAAWVASLHDCCRELGAKVVGVELKTNWIHHLQTHLLVFQHSTNFVDEVLVKVAFGERFGQAPHTCEYSKPIADCRSGAACEVLYAKSRQHDVFWRKDIRAYFRVRWFTA